MSDEELIEWLKDIRMEASYKGNTVTWILLFGILIELGMILNKLR